MPTFTVHAPPERMNDASTGAERFRFVRDGFYFWAFALTPLWLLLHRLWLALLIYVVGYGAIGVATTLLRVSPSVELIAGVIVAVLIGMEASSVWRWTLARRGWTTVGFVVGEDAELAERRFYGEWSRRGIDISKSESAPAQYSTPVRRGPPSPSDVIGLFPEPGGRG